MTEGESSGASAGDACPDLAALTRFADGSMADGAEAGTLAAHLGVCEACRARLAEIRETENFLRRIRPGPASANIEIAEHPGSVVGRYTLLEQIGEGGFGVVFSARQTEPVSRRVALKILKPGMDSRQVLARFEAERHTLALMDHPNIARVLDAGTTVTGRPFFVMELVDGLPITRFCDEHKLTLRERLKLFRTVCAAVQHAHQKGIIHRDIKPSNVMVTLRDGAPVPKVIDFGIAKATDQHLAEQAAFTRLGQFIGTPEYTSPEQAAGPSDDIDTRSDVYSLGVLLYELLTGATPLDPERLRSAGLAEMQRVIREGETPRPSTRLSTIGGLEAVAASRRIDPRRLALQLRGELDWILLKTLEKDRARRYDTVAALAEDLRRFLDREPVLAGPPSATYRLRKFIRRHRGPVAAGVALGALLLAGLAGTTAGMVRATNAERQAGAEAAWANQVASMQTSPFLSDGLRDSHRDEWAARLATMRETAPPNDPDLIRQEGLFAVWGWASYVGEAEVTLRANVAPPRFGLPARIYEAQLRSADAAEEWGARIAEACERSRGILEISDPLWVALVNNMIRWEQGRGATAPELARWYDTIVQASDAAYGELSDFSLAMLCERAAALGEAGDFDEGMRTIEEYVHRRRTAVVALSDAQYMRHERIVAIFDGNDNTETYWQFLRHFDQDAKDLSKQATSNYFIYSGQIYGMWLWTYGHYEEADRVLSELLQVMRSPLANQLTNARLIYRIGVCRMLLGRPAEALELLRESENILTTRSISWYQPCYLAQARGWLGQCLSDLGNYEEAEAPLLASHEWLLAQSFEQQLVAEATQRLIQLYERWGKQDEAAVWRQRLADDVVPAPDRPENLGFEQGAEGDAPPGWVQSAALAEAGAVAELTRDQPTEGAMCVRLGPPPPGKTINSIRQEFTAVPYRDRRVRISASVRVDAPAEADRAEIGLRIEPRELDGFSYYENSIDRPIRWAEWDRFEIECDVSGDAARMYLWMSVHGAASAWLDDIRIEIIEPGSSEWLRSGPDPG